MNRENTQALLADLEPMKEERQLKVTIDERLEATLEKLLKHYESKILPQCWHFDSGWDPYTPFRQATRYFKQQQLDITPKAVEEFILRITGMDFDNYATCHRNINVYCEIPFNSVGIGVGAYITAMAQHSFDSGNNGFVLNIELLGDMLTKNFHMFSIGSRLKGKTSRNIELSIYGNVGGLLLYGAKYVKAQIYSVWHNGMFARTANCDITLHKPINKKVINGVEAIKNCKFRSRFPSVLEKIKAAATKDSKNCKFYLINPDGTESLFAKI